ncbi:2-dehydro-3-deoxygalactonokinase [Planctomicrobium sp. SH527]|uniref:2-dehydro-3-deoxygalactonokinase n=1 Tax=Planctomicrobium sp. SH527 TaxID=3448123 RepID=UPI003F5B75FC
MSDYFFNCDWGTTNFRLRLVSTNDGAIIAECRSEDGAAILSAAATSPENREERFRDVLDRSVAAMRLKVDSVLDQTPIIISGMASSSIGWRNLPYAVVPFALDGGDLSFERLDEKTATTGHPTYLLSGLRSDRDVMRGEEVELMGLTKLPDVPLDGVGDTWVILPGTHSKHVQIQKRIVVDFRTYMTGELFDVLGHQSSLQHSLKDATGTIQLPDSSHPQWKDAFESGVQLAQTDELSSILFQVRTGQLLKGNSASQSSALLSGILIGAELQALNSRLNTNDEIVLAAAGHLSTAYQTAADQLGLARRLFVVPPTDVARLSSLGQLQALQKIAP